MGKLYKRGELRLEQCDEFFVSKASVFDDSVECALLKWLRAVARDCHVVRHALFLHHMVTAVYAP